MIKKFVFFVFLLTGPAWGDFVVSIGDIAGFAAPNPPYDPTQELTLKVTLGYGAPTNTIGEGVWFSGPGVFDLSADPNLDGFLEFATNGKNDAINVTVTDGNGSQFVYPFPGMNREGMFLGNFPDLAPLEITGAQLRVFDVAIGDPANGGNGGGGVRWEFLGVPEPSSISLLAACFILVSRLRAKCTANKSSFLSSNVSR